MLKTQFVILFLILPALSIAGQWSQKVVKTQNQSTLATLCKNVSQRIHTKVCKSLSKAELAETQKVKWAVEDSKTVRLKYLDATVRIRETDEPSTFLVNRKSLYLEEMGSDQDLKKKLTKILGSENSVALNAVLLFLFQNSEHQTCYAADRAIQNCTKVSTLDAPTLEKKSSQKLLSQGLQFSDSFKHTIHYLSPSQSQALKQCACEKSLCGFPKEKNKNPPKITAYDQCKKNLQKLKKEASDVAQFEDYTKKVLSLHVKEKSRVPALFKEDSYKGK